MWRITGPQGGYWYLFLSLYFVNHSDSILLRLMIICFCSWLMVDRRLCTYSCQIGHCTRGSFHCAITCFMGDLSATLIKPTRVCGQTHILFFCTMSNSAHVIQPKYQYWSNFWYSMLSFVCNPLWIELHMLLKRGVHEWGRFVGVTMKIHRWRQ